MKMAFLAAILAMVVSGCSTYDSDMGATGDEYYNGLEAGRGSAADIPSPGGLDRARGLKEDPYLERRDHGGNNP